MTDPYKVLEIDRGASDDEIKKAYRKMSRLYHPDANVNNPNAEAAEEKFKEVQAAYQQIMKEKEQGPYTGGYSQGGYTYGQSGYGYGDTQYRDPFEEMFGRAFYGGAGRSSYSGDPGWQEQFQGEDRIKMQAAANYINNAAYREALNVLDSVLDRQAHWYYFCSLAHSGMGNNVNAVSYARRAAEMDPTNVEYQNLIHILENGGQWYQQRSQDFGGMEVCNLNRLCCYCCMLQSCMYGCGAGGLPVFLCC